MLLLNRIKRLRHLIVAPPGSFHASNPGCGTIEQQRDVLSPWALAAASIIIEARADFPPLAIQSIFNPLLYRCACAECREMMQSRIGQVLQKWDAEKVSRCWPLPRAYI